MLRRRTFAIVATMASIACQDTAAPPPPVAAVRITPDSTFVFVHGATQLVAAAYDASGHPLSGHPIAWSSADTTIATVDSTGLVRGVRVGSVYLRAASEGHQAFARIDAELAIAQLAVSPKLLLIGVADTFQMSGAPLDSSGHPISGRVVTWTSSDDAIVHVLPLGRIVGHALGSVRVTGDAEGHTDTARVIVGVPVDSVRISPASAIVAVGDTTRFTPTLYGRGGQTPTDPVVTWTSSDSSTASVDSSGLVTTHKTGGMTITAHADRAVRNAVVTITVPIGGVTIVPKADTALSDSTVAFAVTVRDTQGNTIYGFPTTVTSTDTNVAKVTNQGILARLAGAAHLIATASHYADTATLVVFRPSVATVTLTLDSSGLWTDQPSQLRALEQDSASNILRRPVTWSSTAPSVAQITPVGPDSLTIRGSTAGMTLLIATVEGHADTTPLRVDTVAGHFASVTTGGAFTCGLSDAHVTYCWGFSNEGEVGVERSDRPCDINPQCFGQPVMVSGGFSFNTIVSGDEFSCGIAADSTAWCWGADNFGQLGAASDTTCPSYLPCNPTPHAVNGAPKFITIAAGFGHACGIATDSTAYCWGNNNAGQLGGDSLNHVAPHALVAVYGGLKYRSLALGETFSCGVTADSLAYCWGFGEIGQLGADTTTHAAAPLAVAGNHFFQQVVAGRYHVCGLDTGGHAYCWGANGSGMGGNGTTTPSSSPRAVSGNLQFQTLFAGGLNSCGLTPGAVMYCWGADDQGQLASGVGAFRTTPTVLPGPAMVQVSFSAFTGCGIAAGTPVLYCWGNNGSGTGGLGPAVPFIISQPTRVIGQH